MHRSNHVNRNGLRLRHYALYTFLFSLRRAYMEEKAPAALNGDGEDYVTGL